MDLFSARWMGLQQAYELFDHGFCLVGNLENSAEFLVLQFDLRGIHRLHKRLGACDLIEIFTDDLPADPKLITAHNISVYKRLYDGVIGKHRNG